MSQIFLGNKNTWVCCKMKVLQQTRFRWFGSGFSNIVSISERKMDKIFELKHDKADREASHDLAVENFSVLFATQLFPWNNGFQAFFFAASSTSF